MDIGQEEGREAAKRVVEALDNLAKAATEIDENGCGDCRECEEMSECLQSLRRAVGYIAECMARVIESNIKVNDLLMAFMKKNKQKEKQEGDYDGFYS